jgi:hypothetical protein
MALLPLLPSPSGHGPGPGGDAGTVRGTALLHTQTTRTQGISEAAIEGLVS